MFSNLQKQPPRGVPRKRCSENMQQIYRKPPVPKCDFNKRCVKSVQIRSFFWSVFSHIWTEHREIRSISPYSVRVLENKDRKKLRILDTFHRVKVAKKLYRNHTWAWVSSCKFAAYFLASNHYRNWLKSLLINFWNDIYFYPIRKNYWIFVKLQLFKIFLNFLIWEICEICAALQLY